MDDSAARRGGLPTGGARARSGASDAADRPVTVLDFARRKRAGEPIAMITAYDALFASLVDAAGVDAVLVGDSVATALCGEETTLSATVEQMIYHGRLVRRGARRALVIVDMPFMSYQVSPRDAVRNGGRILKETGAGALKLEGGAEFAPAVEALVTAGVPVMGHLGFTPQSVHQLGGPRGHARAAGALEKLIRDARALEKAGAFAIVLSTMPGRIAQKVTHVLSIPTIGFGAGPLCDGQVLVLPEMLGLTEGDGTAPSKRYAELDTGVREAVARFAQEVRGGLFPGAEPTSPSPPRSSLPPSSRPPGRY